MDNIPAGLDTVEGRVKVQIPQLCESPDPYSSKPMKSLLEGHWDCVSGNSLVLERLTIKMYTRGLSTWDIEDAFREVIGDILLSRTAVSNLIDQLLDHRSFFLISTNTTK